MDVSGLDAAPPPGPPGPFDTPPPHASSPEEAALPPAGPAARSGWQLGRTEPRRRTFWLGCLAIILVPVVLVAAILLLVRNEVGTIVDFAGDTGGQITSVDVHQVEGRLQWELYAAPGLGPRDGPQLACDVVRPVFRRHGVANAEFYVLDRAGDVIASWQTPCTPVQPAGPVS
jgi:hypothetical protein